MAIGVVAALLLLLRCAVAADVPSVNLDDLDPLKECKRRDVSLVTSNNKVYMYGGKSWLKNGTEEPYSVINHHLRIVDFTSARNLSDWSILSAKDIDESVTIFKEGAFWADENKLWVVGGQVPEHSYLRADGTWLATDWKFSGATVFSYDIKADSWKTESAVQPTSGTSARGTFCCGAFGWNAGTKRGYVYSGSDWAGTRQVDPVSAISYNGPSPDQTWGTGNVLTFDTPSFTWANDTTDTDLTTPWTENGQYVYLPGTESATGGVAVVLGGVRKKPNEMMESLRSVLVFDSAKSIWYRQQTTAENDNFPPNRQRFCSVAASAPDNTSHNIYVYAGESPETKPDALSDMWILTVPAFHWIPVNVTSEPRKSLGCTRLADRYMVTYGGSPGGWGNTGDDAPCDQENYGLRLFDLVDLEWKGQYEGPAAQNGGYAIPSAVHKVIGGDAKGGATRTAPSNGFGTPAVKALFQNATETDLPQTTASEGGGPESTSTSASMSTSIPPPAKKSNTGAIAGGAVAGVAGLALVIGGVFLLLRRRRARAPAYAPDSVAYEVGGSEHYRSEASYPSELSGNGRDGKVVPHEIYSRSTSPVEMDGGYARPLVRGGGGAAP